MFYLNFRLEINNIIKLFIIFNYNSINLILIGNQ